MIKEHKCTNDSMQVLSFNRRWRQRTNKPNDSWKSQVGSLHTVAKNSYLYSYVNTHYIRKYQGYCFDFEAMPSPWQCKPLSSNETGLVLQGRCAPCARRCGDVTGGRSRARSAASGTLTWSRGSRGCNHKFNNGFLNALKLNHDAGADEAVSDACV